MPSGMSLKSVSAYDSKSNEIKEDKFAKSN